MILLFVDFFLEERGRVTVVNVVCLFVCLFLYVVTDEALFSSTSILLICSADFVVQASTIVHGLKTGNASKIYN